MFKPSYNIDFDNNKLSGKTSWKSPSNIALIKYRHVKLPFAEIFHNFSEMLSHHHQIHLGIRRI